MSKKEFERFEANNGRLTTRPKGSSELYVTQDEKFVEELSKRVTQKKRSYEVNVEIEVVEGTMEAIKKNAATHPSAATAYPELPKQTKGSGKAEIKMEKGGVESVGLGKSTEALEQFNDSIVNYKAIDI